MLTVYHRSKTKLGYVYFSPQRDQHINILKTFKSEFDLKNHMVKAQLDSFKFDLESFVTLFRENEKCETHIHEQALKSITKFLFDVNELDADVEFISKGLKRLKEDFVTLVKASKDSQDDLFMIYKYLKKLL